MRMIIKKAEENKQKEKERWCCATKIRETEFGRWSLFSVDILWQRKGVLFTSEGRVIPGISEKIFPLHKIKSNCARSGSDEQEWLAGCNCGREVALRHFRDFEPVRYVCKRQNMILNPQKIQEYAALMCCLMLIEIYKELWGSFLKWGE